MHLLSEIRRPTTWYARLVTALLAIGFFAIMAAVIVSGYVVYTIVVSPPETKQSINLASFPGQPEDVSYTVKGIGSRDGWFFPGLKSAPTILLCPGYRSSRGELLPLAIALQDHQYNVFLFDFNTAGTKSGYSTLGYREAQELRAALSVVAGRPDVDRTRFGVWGTNLGSYAALALAESDARVRAVAVESVYDQPKAMVNLLGQRSGLVPLAALRTLTERMFMVLNYKDRNTPPLSADIAALAGVPKLFITAADEPALITSTHKLFVAAPEPKEEVMLAEGNYAGMLGEEKRTYENRLIIFFLLNLPPEARSRP
jgi:pimeloyl-ACP methyl ester carboxylesterase